jgi:prephenate dehydratase
MGINMKVGFLGPVGSYSSLAKKKLFGNDIGIEYSNFYAIFKGIKDDEADCGVIPIENSLQGTVSQCLDLLFQSENLYIIQETAINIEHRLIVKPRCSISDIHTVYSHEQAIKQCGKFISETLKNAKIKYTDSTSASADMVKNFGDAGIVGSHFKKDGLILLNETIADELYNQTRFVVIKKGIDKLENHSKKIFIAVGSKNKPGALLEILTILSNNKLNMSKIESRPLKTKLGEYIFFIEFEGDIGSEVVINALQKLKDSTINYKLLGVY